MALLDRIAFWRRTAAPTSTRSYDGAGGGRRAPRRTFGRINSEVGAAGQTLAARASYLYANQGFVRNAVDNLVADLVGTGPMPNPSDRQLGTFFAAWWDDADVQARTDWTGLLVKLVTSMIVKGEGLALIADEGDGPQLRCLDPALIDSSKTGDDIIQGVHVNPNGRPLGYWIHPESPATEFASYRPSVYVPAEEVIHIFKGEPDQIRGASWLAPLIVPASDFDGYTDSLLVAAKVAAAHAGFITRENDISGDSEDIPASTIEPGLLMRLKAGESVVFNSPAQLQNSEHFLKFGLRQLACGLGVPDFLLSGDLNGANYSSLRAGLLPYRRRLEQIQYSILVPQVLNPVWRAVITHGILSGKLQGDLETALRTEWVMPAVWQVDPAKDLEATEKELTLGLTSRRRAVQARGWILSDLDEEIAADSSEQPAAKSSEPEKEAQP